MSVEIASLKIEIDSTSAAKAEAALDRLAAAGERAQASARNTVTATQRAGIAMDGSATSTQRASKSATDYATSQGAVERATAQSAAAMERAARAADVMARRVNAIEKALDPASAVTLTLAERTATLDKALASGAITAERHAAVHAKVTKAANDGAAVMTKYAGAAKLTSNQLTNLSFQLNDVLTGIASGQKPFQILAQQGGQVFQALQQGAGGFMGSLRALAGLIGPTVAVIGSLVAVVGGLGALWVVGEKSANGYERAVSGVGRVAQITAADLRALTVAGASQGDISIKAAQEQAEAYLRTGQVGRETLGSLLALGKDYASFMGTDAANATKSLAQAMSDPEKAAREMTRAFGLLSQEQIKQVDAALKVNDLSRAQKIILDELKVAVEGHAEQVSHITSAWDAVGRAISNAITKLGEFLYVTKDERLARLNSGIATAQKQGGNRPGFIADLTAQRDALAKEIAADQARFTAAGKQAAANQSSQRAVDYAKAHKPAAVPRDTTDQRTAQVESLVAQARADELQAQLALARGIRERADLEKQVLAEDLARKQADTARQIASIKADQGLHDDKKRELIGQLQAVQATEARTAALKTRAADEAKEDALAKEALDIANAGRDGQAAVLQAQLNLATTAAQRGEIEMKLLSLADERAKAELQGVIAAKGSSDTQVAIADEQLKTLEATRADRERAAQKKTAIAGAEEIISELGQIDALAVQAGQSLGDAFGGAGDALGGLLANLTGFRLQMAQIRKEEISGEKTVQQAARARGELQIRTYGDMAGAAKGFFKEGSRGYKALEIAEQAYRLIQFANSVQAVFLKGAETAATVTGAASETAAVAGAETAKTAATAAGTAVRTPLKISEGAASMFAALGPLGFPVVAAMLAVMAGLGFRGGGGGASSVPLSEQRQHAQGAGSVLGDSSAKSDSIAHSLEIVASNTNRDLEYSNDMLRALRSIDTNIGALTAQLAKELNVGGALDTSGLNLGTSSSGPGLIQRILNPISNILPGLFGTKTTTNLLDQGIQFAPQTVGGIGAGGLEGDAYQTTQTTKKKKFFGVVVSNKTNTNTATQDLNQDITNEMQRVIASLRDGVLAAASTLGIDGAKATLDAFTVNLGQISFTGKTGTEIGAELEAVFSKLGDQMAEAAVPGLSAMQKAGEGAFETLARVAREYQVVDVALQSIGKSFGSVGLASLAARDDLVQLFGTLDDFAAATQAFADDFLSEAERMAPIQKAVQDQLARLGVTGVNTKDQFKQLVLAQDLTTQSGREMYAQLLAVGPAFAKVANYLAEGSKEIQEARDALSAAYERESEALQGTIDRFRQFAASLSEFRESLYTGPAALLSPEAAYNASKAKFEDVSTRAAAGDEKALEDLQNVSQAYLDASRTYYASSGAYFADLAKVRTAVEAAETTATHTADTATQQLDALKASVSGLIDINESVISVHDAIITLTALLAGQAGASATPFSPLSPAGSPAPGATTATNTTGGTDAYTTPGFGDYGTPVAVNDNTGSGDPYGGAYGGAVPMDYSGLTGNLQPLDQIAPNWEQQFGDPMGMRFASGGAFSNGVVSKPTAFDVGQMGEAGDEGILPLANIGGKLGVYSTGGGSDQDMKDLLAEQNRLLEEVVTMLQASAEAITSTDTANTGRVVKAMQSGNTLERLKAGGIAA